MMKNKGNVLKGIKDEKLQGLIGELLDNMVFVEGGYFVMGNTNVIEKSLADFDYDEDKEYLVVRREPDEHKVRVKLSSFYICKYVVTQDLWKEVMGWNHSYFYVYGDKRPVECVSWYQCQKFIAKLNELTGLSFRLPTECEWEFAATSRGEKFQFAGSDNVDDVAHYYNFWDLENPTGGTCSVGRKQPNTLGLYDMSGNVWEWCQDWYQEMIGGSTGADALDDAIANPRGPETGEYKVIRGGSWKEWVNSSRVSFRNACPPDASEDDGLGLRLVMDVEKEDK